MRHLTHAVTSVIISLICSCSSMTIDQHISDEDTPNTAFCITALMNNEGIREVNNLIDSWNSTYTNWKYGIKSKEVDETCIQWLQDVEVRCFSGNCITGIHKNKEYMSYSRFNLSVNKSIPEVRVTIRLLTYTSIATLNQQYIWKKNIENAWSRRVKIVYNNRRGTIEEYPVVIDIQWIGDSESTMNNHFFISPISTGRSDETTWALDDPEAPAHEVGHMLGNDDEYGIVNNNNYICNMTENRHIWETGDCPWRKHIMHHRFGKPTKSNYDLILKETQGLFGEDNFLIDFM